MIPERSILYEGGFPDGKARLMPAAPLAGTNSKRMPMYLVPGIIKFHSGSFSEWSPSLMEVCPEGFAEMNVKDLKALGLKDGDKVKISDADGDSIQVKVKQSRRAMPKTVIVPQHFSQIKLNTLTRWDESGGEESRLKRFRCLKRLRNGIRPPYHSAGGQGLAGHSGCSDLRGVPDTYRA